MQRLLDILIEFFIIFLVIFTPVAFGTVDLWAITVMELVIFFLSFLWLLKSIIKGELVLVDTALNTPIIAFIILVTAQYILGRATSSRFGTIYPYATRVHLFEMLSYILAFLIVINNIQKRSKINRILFSIISVGAILSIYGIVQKLAGPQKIYWMRPVHEVLLFYSSYVNCNYFAGYVNMVIALSLGVYLAYLRHLDEKKKYRKFNLFEEWNGLFLFSITTMIASLLYTSSHGGMLVFLITTLLFCYMFFKKALSKRRVIVIAFLLMLISASLVSAWVSKKGILSEIREFLGLFGSINRYGLRMPIWVRTLKLIGERPFLGTGLGTFQHIFPKYKPNYGLFFSHCHNDYLELLAETGSAGLLIFIFGMWSFLKRYARLLDSRHDPYAKRIGYGCFFSIFSIFVYSFIDSNMHIGANALLFSFILAIGFAVINNRVDASGNEMNLSKTITFTIKKGRTKIIVFLLAGLSFSYLVNNAVSISLADMYAMVGSNKNSIELIKKAIRLEPSSSEYHYMLADRLLKEYATKRFDKEILDEITDELKESIRLNPNSGRYHQTLGWIYTFYGSNREEALKYIRNAQGLEPLNVFNYLLSAIYYFNEATKRKGVNPYGSKDMEKGVEEYRKALSLDAASSIDRYKEFLEDYQLIKETLKKYSL